MFDTPSRADREANLRHTAKLRELLRRSRTAGEPVSPAAGVLPAPPRRRMVISEASAKLLEGAAQGLTDRRLRAALLRLARRARQRA